MDSVDSLDSVRTDEGRLTGGVWRSADSGTPDSGFEYFNTNTNADLNI